MPPRDKGRMNGQKLQKTMNGGLVVFACETCISARVVWNVGQLWHILFAHILKVFPN